MWAQIFPRGESCPIGHIYIVDRGSALFAGRTHRAGHVWGEAEAVLTSDALRFPVPALALTYLFTYSIDGATLRTTMDQPRYPIAAERLRSKRLQWIMRRGMVRAAEAHCIANRKRFMGRGGEMYAGGLFHGWSEEEKVLRKSRARVFSMRSSFDNVDSPRPENSLVPTQSGAPQRRPTGRRISLLGGTLCGYQAQQQAEQQTQQQAPVAAESRQRPGCSQEPATQPRVAPVCVPTGGGAAYSPTTGAPAAPPGASGAAQNMQPLELEISSLRNEVAEVKEMVRTGLANVISAIDDRNLHREHTSAPSSAPHPFQWSC